MRIGCHWGTRTEVHCALATQPLQALFVILKKPIGALLLMGQRLCTYICVYIRTYVLVLCTYMQFVVRSFMPHMET